MLPPPYLANSFQLKPSQIVSMMWIHGLQLMSFRLPANILDFCHHHTPIYG